MKKDILRIVFDTNVIVSALYFPRSTPSAALEFVLTNHKLLLSFEIIQEINEVIFRKKFDKYTPLFRREEFIELLVSSAEEIVVSETIKACKDPKDDKFLEAAVSGKANLIITGDGLLKDLHPFRGIDILSAADFLEKNTSL